MAPINPPSALEKEQIFGMAEKEMEYRVELFNKLTQTCFSKCVENRYKESELNMGENSCIDRCVSKYWQITFGYLGIITEDFKKVHKDMLGICPCYE